MQSEVLFYTIPEKEKGGFEVNMGCVLVYRYTKERNINELCHNSMYGYENNRNSPVYWYTRTAPQHVLVQCTSPGSYITCNISLIYFFFQCPSAIPCSVGGKRQKKSRNLLDSTAQTLCLCPKKDKLNPLIWQPICSSWGSPCVQLEPVYEYR